MHSLNYSKMKKALSMMPVDLFLLGSLSGIGELIPQTIME